MLASVLECITLVLFGLSWPSNIMKLYKNKSTVGVSLTFLILIDLGYVCGIVSKIIRGDIMVLSFYILDFILVTTDIILYLTYAQRERKAKKENEK